eukprot:PRCOL_00004658-RA
MAAMRVAVDTAELVDRLLAIVRDSDCGRTLSAERKAEADALIDQLEAAGAGAPESTLARGRSQGDSVFGDYTVAYQSVGGAQKGSPAGGRFTGRLGRALFRTRGLFQCIGPGDAECSNKVEFSLFGVMRGFVSLQGTFAAVAASAALRASADGALYARDGVRVRFERPRLRLGPLSLRFGPESEVELYTPYCDSRVRLGLGSRGSRFVFTRDAPPRARADELPPAQGERRSLLGMACLAAGGGLAAWLAGASAAAGGALAALAAAGLALALAVLRDGGIEDDAYSRLA